MQDDHARSTNAHMLSVPTFTKQHNGSNRNKDFHGVVLYEIALSLIKSAGKLRKRIKTICGHPGIEQVRFDLEEGAAEKK